MLLPELKCREGSRSCISHQLRAEGMKALGHSGCRLSVGGAWQAESVKDGFTLKWLNRLLLHMY